MSIIKVGDTVMWRGAWGRDAARPAKIVGMELCEAPRMKEGIRVRSAFLADKARLVVDLDNGSWAYGFQIEPIEEDANEPAIYAA